MRRADIFTACKAQLPCDSNGGRRRDYGTLAIFPRVILPLSARSYLSGSCTAAAAFAKRGDGTGTTVWPRSAFGSDKNGSTPGKFRYRLVAKCRVLNGDGVKEVKSNKGAPPLRPERQ